MATDRQRLNAGIMVALAVAGLLLVALPWIDRPGSNPLPAAFAPGSPAHLQLLACVKRLDDSCRAGDLAAFHAAVSKGFVDDLDQQLRQLDRSLDRAALLGMVAEERRGGLLGELQRLRCLSGHSRGNLACLLYGYGDAAVFDGVKVVRCRWDGYQFRVDVVREVRRPAGVDPGELRQALVRSLLDG